METLRRFSAFPVRYIKCKVATVMGKGIRVLSRLASVAVFSASFLLFFIAWPCAFRTLFSLCQKGTETTSATLEGVADFLQLPWSRTKNKPTPTKECNFYRFILLFYW